MLQQNGMARFVLNRRDQLGCGEHVSPSEAAQRAHQCFGHWAGWMIDDAGERVPVDGVLGWAEDVHNRW